MSRVTAVCLCLVLAGCVTTGEANNFDMTPTKKYHGVATWYAKGKRTADGSKFDPNKYSVAHRTFPFGTMLRLTNESNGSSIVAVVNDRGPFVRTKELDVSRGGAQALGFTNLGTAKLLIEVLPWRRE